MEIKNFNLEDCNLKGFCKKVIWNNKENSFYLSVISCIIDSILRFSGKEQLNSMANTLEYELSATSKLNLDKKSGNFFKKFEVFLEGYNELKNVENGKLEVFYKKLEEDMKFVDEMGEWTKDLLMKSKVIKNCIDIEDMHQVLKYFYSRFKICIIIHKDGKWINSHFNEGFAIFCPISYENGFNRLLTEEFFGNLKADMTELKFPFIFQVDWESKIMNNLSNPVLSNENSENDHNLLKILTQIILQVPLNPEEEHLILLEYSKSGIISEELEFLKLRSFTQSNILNYPKNTSIKCDDCKSICSSNLQISCATHCLCINCRLNSFSSTYSSTCPRCNRDLTPCELTILNSYI